jgi:hypothetical protein
MKNKALFMIFLIVTLPVVFAQELNVNKYSGKDNANGAIRTEDNLTIEVRAQIPGDPTIMKDQVRLVLGTEFLTFDNCVKTAEPNYYTCTFEDEVELFENVPFMVELWNDDNVKVKTANASIIVDALSPSVKNFSVTPEMSNGNVDISFKIQDYGLNSAVAAQCSGIKSVLIVSQQGDVNTTVATRTGTSGTCLLEDEFPVTLTTSGAQTICLYTKDFVNYDAPPKCVNIVVDHTPPTISAISILNHLGDDITHIHSGNEIPANVHALITDDGQIDTTQVFADFNKLSPAYGINAPADYNTGSIYTWSQIPVREVSPCTLTIKATDMLGNTATKQIDCSIRADDAAPILVRHKPQAMRGNTSLLGYDTPFILEFDEKDNTGAKGIGMSLINAYLDMSSIGLTNFERADTCYETEGTKWECAWYVKPPASKSQGAYTFTLVEGTSDDLDNFATFGQTFNVIYDNDGPDGAVLKEFRIISQEEAPLKEGAIRGDSLSFVVSAANFTSVTANFSDFGGDQKATPIEIGCSSDNDTVDCEFVQPIELEGPYTGVATFTFVDDANNRAVVSKQIEIYGVGAETSANFWTVHSIDCTPKLIDREVASYLNPYQSCRINLRTPRSDITPLSITTTENWETDCTGNSSFIRDMYVSNYVVGKKDPYLVYVFDATDYKMDNLTINCPLIVRSLKTNSTGKFAIPGSQTVNVNTTFEFYNNPAGEAYKNLDSKIERAVSNGFTTWEWLEELQKILHYAQQICTLISTIDNLLNSVFVFIGVMGGLGGVLQKSAYPPTVATGQTVSVLASNTCNAEVRFEGIYSDIRTPLLTICGIATCSSAADKDWAVDFNWLGGGVPWCRGEQINFANFGIPALEQTGVSRQDVNIRDSLVLSTVCLCLPGIIYNLEKMRQIYCFEAVCYHDMVKEQGYPVSFCNGQYNYMWCTFVINEVFAGAPFVGLFNKMMDMVVSIVSNPFLAIGVAIGLACQATCQPISADGSAVLQFQLCSGYKMFAMAMEAVSVFWAMANAGSDFWRPVQNNYCDRADEIRKNYEDKE